MYYLLRLFSIVIWFIKSVLWLILLALIFGIFSYKLDNVNKNLFFQKPDPELKECARKVYYGRMPLSVLDVSELITRCGKNWREKLAAEIRRLKSG